MNENFDHQSYEKNTKDNKQDLGKNEAKIFLNPEPLFHFEKSEKIAKEKIESNEEASRLVKEFEEAGFRIFKYGQGFLVGEKGISYNVLLYRDEVEISDNYETITRYKAQVTLYENGEIEASDEFWPETTETYIGPEEPEE